MSLQDSHPDIFAAFHKRKVLSLPELMELLKKSVATVRRRLKEWKVFSSYNHNGRYYVLPEIPQFDVLGLWKYQNIFFSKSTLSAVGVVGPFAASATILALILSTFCSVI